MRSSFIAGITLALLVSGIAETASAQTLQRLFTTPQQRVILDRARMQEIQRRNTQALNPQQPIVDVLTDAQIQETSEPTAVTLYTLGGTVARSDGSFNVWINQTAYNASNLPQNMQLLQPYSQGQLRIRNPETGIGYTIKSGQTLNLLTGQIYEAYQISTARSQPQAVPNPTTVDAGAVPPQTSQ